MAGPSATEPSAKRPREHLPLTRFANCRVLRGHSLAAADLWVQGGVIVEPQRLFYGSFQRADVVIDCEGLILAPGYIDVQLNGGFGVDFCSADDGGLAAGVRTVAERVLAHGVTAFLPTVITSSADAYRRILPQLAPTAGSATAAAVLGVTSRARSSRRRGRAATRRSTWRRPTACPTSCAAPSAISSTTCAS